MVQRVPKGTVSAKASGTTLTLSEVQADAGDLIIVGVCFDDSQGDPTTVKWGAKDLAQKVKRNNAVAGITTATYIKRLVHKTRTADIVLTWSVAIAARAMFVTVLKGVNGVDRRTGKIDIPVTSPGTGNTGTLITAGSFVVGVEYEIVTIGTTDFTLIGAASNTVGLVFTATGVGSGTGDAREALEFPDDFVICAFGSAGPVEDAAGDPEIENDGTLQSANSGQRAGTTGGAATSNVTIHETWLPLTSTTPTRGRLQNATQRRWANALMAFGGKWWKVTISGTYTAETFVSAENSTEADTEASILDEEARREMVFTDVVVSTVDSVVEQIFGTDYVK